MKNSVRYMATTFWGTFSLDEGSYKDYLAGRSWICWDPSGSAHHRPRTAEPPVGISADALQLRDRAAQIGVIALLKEICPEQNVRIPYKAHMEHISIQEMSISVQSGNGLMRAGAATFGRLMALLETEKGLLGVRNLGAKSEKEITGAFLQETYQRLDSSEKAIYWQEMLDSR